jgi:hypothetical protein
MPAADAAEVPMNSLRVSGVIFFKIWVQTIAIEAGSAGFVPDALGLKTNFLKKCG